MGAPLVEGVRFVRFQATGRWWRTQAAPWLASNRAALLGALLGGVLCALIGCGRGGGCPAPKNAAQSTGQQTSPRPCDLR